MSEYDYYYCFTEHYHAVVEAKDAASAKECFIKIINKPLESEYDVKAEDVTVWLVGVYQKEHFEE